jgi:hypothetical protein
MYITKWRERMHQKELSGLDTRYMIQIILNNNM